MRTTGAGAGRAVFFAAVGVVGPVWAQGPNGPNGPITVVQVNVNAAGQNIPNDRANEPSIAIDPSAPNRLVMGWREIVGPPQAGYGWSNDGGRSWHFPGVLTPGLLRSDPVVESDAAGNFYYYSLAQTNPFRCDLFRSTDGGATWSGPVVANGGDRAWMAIDKSRGIGDGNIYGIWNPQFSCCGGASFGRDVNGGMGAWPPPVTIAAAPRWGTAAVGPDGEVYVAGVDPAQFRVVRSDNARDRFQVPTFPQNVVIDLGGPPVFTNGDGPNPGGALGQVWVDVNRSDGPARGHVYVLGLYNPPGDDPLDAGFARSTDGGLTWSAPVRVNADPPAATSWNWFPSMSVAPAGRIDVTYNANFESGQTGITRTYYTFSTDEGANWSAPVPLTPAWNSLVVQSKVGDYYDQESDDVGLSLAIAATMNGEHDIYFVRVGDWDCNRNGIPDAQDLIAGTAHDCDRDGVPDECEIAAGAEPDVNHNGIPDGCECYADCTGDGRLTVPDFECFRTRFVGADPYADCNADGALTVADFGCFQTKFVVGCR